MIPAVSPASTAADNLIAEAHARQLQNERKWHALLHYKPGLLWGVESVIDDPSFFLSDDGKIDPLAELDATIVAFFSNTVTGDAHPLCRYPSRAAWLKRELSIDRADLPDVECRELNKYINVINPRAAALVFPESHVNSPASMFGHTLIRVDSDYESRLLSYAINYAAVTPGGFDLMFAVRGVFGGYNGYFSAVPYYEKINTYTHMESRDIWEYPLLLTEDEVRDMTMHVWELQNIYTDYYFFDDNCSYILLYILEAARPSARLTDKFFYWVIPTDTLRVATDAGLLNAPVFRPSKATRITHIEAEASADALKAAIDISQGDLAPAEIVNSPTMDEENKIRTLDLASEYLQHMSAKGTVDAEQYSSRFLSTLRSRSSLGKLKYNIGTPPRPEQGHNTARVAIGLGSREDIDYSLMRFRTAYHDLIDPDAGYKPGGAISFMDTEIRYYDAQQGDEANWELERLYPVNITSLSPRGNYFKSTSWRVLGGLEREPIMDASGNSRTLMVLKGGGGISHALSDGKHGFLFAMLEPSIKAGGALTENYSFGGGISAGALIKAGNVYKMLLTGRAVYHSMGDIHGSIEGSVKQMLRLSTNNSIEFDYSRRKLDGMYFNDIAFIWNIYY